MDHFPLPFIDQILECLTDKSFYYFLDGYDGYNQIVIIHEDKTKRLPTRVPLVFLHIEECDLVYVIHLRLFKNV